MCRNDHLQYVLLGKHKFILLNNAALKSVPETVLQFGCTESLVSAYDQLKERESLDSSVPDQSECTIAHSSVLARSDLTLWKHQLLAPLSCFCFKRKEALCSFGKQPSRRRRRPPPPPPPHLLLISQIRLVLYRTW